MAQEQQSKREYLKSWSFNTKKLPLTRNQRFKAALERNHSKRRTKNPTTYETRARNLKLRAFEIQEDEDRKELLNWIMEIQHTLKLSNKEFAKALEVSEKTIQNYRLKVGYLPSKKTYKKLLELEKLTRISVVVKKNRTFFVKPKPVHLIIIN